MNAYHNQDNLKFLKMRYVKRRIKMYIVNSGSESLFDEVTKMF